MNEKPDTITFGNGCFWCSEAVFQNLKGIIKVESGYSGGDLPNPTYREVCSGTTGHAEVIRLTFQPSVISLDDILRVFFSTHDPTTLNRQGADIGTQYRSVIFFMNPAQHDAALRIMKEAQEAIDNPILTELTPFVKFYPAEEDHQNYFNENPGNAYCNAVIPPKLAKLREKYKALLK